MKKFGLRITGASAVIGLLALLLSAWFYAEEKQLSLYSQGTYDFLHSTTFGLASVAVVVLAGFAVGRWWVVAALIGPTLLLGYLQATGYVSAWHDGTVPLLSLRSISALFWFAVTMLLGVGMRHAWDSMRSRSTHPSTP